MPQVADRSTLAKSLSTFLKDNPTLHLGGDADFHQERRHRLEIFGFHALPKDNQVPMGRVEFEGIRGPHGSISIRLFYPKAVVDANQKQTAAPVYMHGGGYTTGSIDEFENGLRLLAEASGAIVRPVSNLNFFKTSPSRRPSASNTASRRSTTYRPS